MKKVFMLLVLLVILTGCSANVDITISPSGIQEEISINAYTDANTSKEQLYSKFRKNMPVFASVPLSDTEPDVKQEGIEYYTRKEKDLGSGYNFEYSYKYKLEDYKNSRSMVLGFDSKTIQRDTVEKNIMISTDSSGLNFFDQYSNLDSVTVNVKTTYKVLKNNADFVNGNTYTWVLRRGTNKGIYILLDDPNGSSSSPGSNVENNDKTVVRNQTTEKEESEFIKFVNEYPVLIALVGILAFLVVVLVVSKLTKINN